MPDTVSGLTVKGKIERQTRLGRLGGGRSPHPGMRDFDMTPAEFAERIGISQSPRWNAARWRLVRRSCFESAGSL